MERFRRLEEAVQIIQRMWTEEHATFEGKFYSIRDAYCNPKPIQKPHPPIMIGGGGERETLKLVAKYADACNIFGSPETVKRKLKILRDHCHAVGRDYDSILKTRLGHVMIDKSREKIEKRAAETLREIPEDRRREFLTYGSPEEIKNQIEEFRNVGIDYYIVNLEADREFEALDIFGNEVVKRF
jgi:alkanesulfonate monooxygenase SsuD/methylene tetrahydromethanopterin reductase-like flavin-dependent oxidoreductase (luciferase family)